MEHCFVCPGSWCNPSVPHPPSLGPAGPATGAQRTEEVQSHLSGDSHSHPSSASLLPTVCPPHSLHLFHYLQCPLWTGTPPQ